MKNREKEFKQADTKEQQNSISNSSLTDYEMDVWAYFCESVKEEAAKQQKLKIKYFVEEIDDFT